MGEEQAHEVQDDLQAILGDSQPGVSGSLHGLRRHIPAHPADPLKQKRWSLDLVFPEGVRRIDPPNGEERKEEIH